MEEIRLKYWISKYALTRGLFTIERGQECYIPSKYRSGDYHETEAAAQSAAEEMRTKKIASLRKQIERLERMEF